MPLAAANAAMLGSWTFLTTAGKGFSLVLVKEGLVDLNNQLQSQCQQECLKPIG